MANTKSTATKKASASRKLKDPRGGLTAAGRKHFAEKEGAHLRPGVKGKAGTPEKMKRKGSFLRRHYANLRGPLKDEDSNPTRLALQAQAWGEPVPKDEADARKLAEKGKKLLEKYQAAKSDGAGNSVKTSGRGAKKSKASQGRTKKRAAPER